jgi:hypothetical protein
VVIVIVVRRVASFFIPANTKQAPLTRFVSYHRFCFDNSGEGIQAAANLVPVPAAPTTTSQAQAQQGGQGGGGLLNYQKQIVQQMGNRDQQYYENLLNNAVKNDAFGLQAMVDKQYNAVYLPTK